MGELIATENGVEFWYGGCYVTSQPEQQISDAQFVLEALLYVYEPNPRAGVVEVIEEVAA